MTKPIVPWPGGKRRLAERILALIPEHRCYVEPFCGAAAVLFAKEPSKVEVLNDINGEMVNLYRVVQHHLEEFVRQFRWALAGRQIFDWAKMAVPETLTDVQRAARFFYLQKLCFGAKVHGQTFGVDSRQPPRLNLLRIEEDLSAAHLRLTRVLIERLPWRACMERYDGPETLFFIDPPYFETAGYGVPFERDQYDLLAEAMRGMKGRAILTINDHPEMRLAFAGFRRQRAQIRYTIGGGQGREEASTELLIRSW